VKHRDAENAPQDDVKREGKTKFPAPDCAAGYPSAANRVGMTSEATPKRHQEQNRDDVNNKGGMIGEAKGHNPIAAGRFGMRARLREIGEVMSGPSGQKRSRGHSGLNDRASQLKHRDAENAPQDDGKRKGGSKGKGKCKGKGEGEGEGEGKGKGKGKGKGRFPASKLQDGISLRCKARRDDDEMLKGQNKSKYWITRCRMGRQRNRWADTQE
jgi:hypothetical protein